MLISRPKSRSSDLLCLKCLLIVVEPVLLPCNHRFCLICINRTIKDTTLSCPYCLQRFGTWLRLKNVSNSSSELVEEGLWKSFRKRFSQLLQKRPDTATSSGSAGCGVLNADTEGCKVSQTYEKHISMGGGDKASSSAARGTDSINIEMTHFRPIRLMPVSIRNTSGKILKIPPIRLKDVKPEAISKFKPAKSKFKQKLTSIHRKSAFCVVQQPAPKPSNQSNSTKAKPAVKLSNDVNAGTESSTKRVASTQLAKKNQNNYLKKPVSPPNNQNHVLNKQNSPQQNNGRVTKGSEPEAYDSKELKSLRRNREQLLLQEKQDYQLAKLLQGYEDGGHSPSGSRSGRYSLRSRGKTSSNTNLLSFNGNGVTKHKNGHSAALSGSYRTLVDDSLAGQKFTRSRRLAIATGDLVKRK